MLKARQLIVIINVAATYDENIGIGGSKRNGVIEAIIS